MFTMQAFHKMLTTTSRGRDRHVDTLASITRADRDQLSALSSDLAWQSWGASSSVV